MKCKKLEIIVPRESLPNIHFSTDALWRIDDFGLHFAHDLVLVNTKKVSVEKGIFGSDTHGI